MGIGYIKRGRGEGGFLSRVLSKGLLHHWHENMRDIKRTFYKTWFKRLISRLEEETWAQFHPAAFKHKKRLSITKLCLPEQGYQPNYHVTSTVCDWYPAHCFLVEFFLSNKNLKLVSIILLCLATLCTYSSSMKLGLSGVIDWYQDGAPSMIVRLVTVILMRET